MRLAICGPRDLIITAKTITSGIYHHNIMGIHEIVSGGASGVDTCAEEYADLVGLHFSGFPANFHKYGRAGGPIRNARIAQYSDVLLAIHEGKNTPGTNSCIKEFRKLGKEVYEGIVN